MRLKTESMPQTRLLATGANIQFRCRLHLLNYGNSHIVNDKQMREFIEQFEWIFAKTYAEICPHEYIVKTKMNCEYWETFKAVVENIRNAGFQALHEEHAGIYYIVDEY